MIRPKHKSHTHTQTYFFLLISTVRFQAHGIFNAYEKEKNSSISNEFIYSIDDEGRKKSSEMRAHIRFNKLRIQLEFRKIIATLSDKKKPVE